MSKAPITATLRWQGGLAFSSDANGVSVTLDGESRGGPSPMRALLLALASCMSIDVVHILQKGRHPLTALEVSVSGTRAETPPRRYTAVELVFHVSGDVPQAAIDRALALSRDNYCSVWHSLREDIALSLTSTTNG